MLGHLTDTYDETAGGWGQQPKFPLPDALEFALKRDREMALRSYDAVGANLLDEYEGGFYRFATEPDWSGLQRETARFERCARAGVRQRLPADRRGRVPRPRRADDRVSDGHTLWNGEVAAFSNSQAPGEDDAYSLDATDRAAAAEPPVDEGVFAGSNALAIEGLLTYYAYTDDDDERARRYAERSLETLREDLLADGIVAHALEDADRDGNGDPVPFSAIRRASSAR